MAEKLVYKYDVETGEFILARPARSNPRRPGQWLLPANCTFDPPPATTEGNVVVFNRETNTWDVVEDNRGKTYWLPDGSSFIIERVNQPIPPEATDEQPDPPLEQAVEEALMLVDNIAEGTRLQHITPGSGQAVTYQEKSTEAARYIADGAPADLTNYPFIQAEVGVTAPTAEEVASIVLATRNQWITLAATIENIRLTAKKNISNASTVTEINDIIEAARQQLNQM